MNSQTILDIMQTDIMDALLTAQQQRLLDTLLDNLDGMIYRCLYDSNWTMIYVSKGCEALTGYPAHALLLNKSTSYETITHPDDRDKARAVIDAAIQKGERIELEYRIVRANGDITWVAARGSAVFDNNGQPVALEGIIQDISCRKRSED